MSALLLAVALDRLLGDPPNRFHPAGETMAGMAGALGVTPGKRGHHRLGDGPPPEVAVVDRAVGVFAAAAGVSLVAALVVLRVVR